VVGVVSWIVACGIWGCGKPETIVEGIITCDGVPLAAAVVQFVPITSDGQTSHAFTHADGSYRARVSPIRLTVPGNAPKLVGKRKAYDTPDSPLIDVMNESLPARYNVRAASVLFVEPVVGASTTAKFDLSTTNDVPRL
jgi:hypothetical protein